MTQRLIPKKMRIKGVFENRGDILFYYLAPCNKKYFLVSLTLKLSRKLAPMIDNLRNSMKEIE